jgi:DNA repair protein RadD
MVLDFAGVVASHGPITAVQPPKKPKPGQEGEAPVKSCPECYELVPPNTKECPSCGYQFPIAQKKLKLHHDDIMGLDGNEMKVSDWRWRKHISRASGKEMLSVSYYGGISDPPIVEYFPVMHEGYAGQKALRSVFSLAQKSGIVGEMKSLEEIANMFNKGSSSPKTIKYKKDGKFFKVTDRSWT